MISGLLALAAVGVIVLATSLVAEPSAPLPDSSALHAQALQPASPPNRRLVTAPSTPHQQVFVFYLVATAAQADLADWGEQIAARDTWSAGSTRLDRRYEILYARDDVEAQSAGATILNRVVDHGRSVTVEIVDMRTVNPGP